MTQLLICLFVAFTTAIFAQSNLDSTYVCPPCHSECDHISYEEDGKCPTCGMKLIFKTERLTTDEFHFTFENTRYSAEIAKYTNRTTIGTVVILPGHGRTDFVAGTQYYELRQFFGRLGFATLVWDKKGCGKSEGNYEHHQSVESSALEAIAAIEALKRRDSTTTSQIGLWGISRAGWICPLVINNYRCIAFWISVSGTDQYDNFRYMVESNLRIEGRSESYVEAVMKEWDHYVRVLRFGGQSYDQLVRSTDKLFNDPFYSSLGETRISEKDFHSAKEYYRKSGDLFDEKTGLRILIPEFENVLSKVKCPVLSIFGEMDSQVDWRKARDLYQKAVGANLEIKELKNCNHNMMQCETGGLFENTSGKVCEEYYESITMWLSKHQFLK